MAALNPTAGIAVDAPTSMDARLSAIVSIAADAIISVDPHQRITLFNTGAEQIFGYTAAEILGQPLDLLLPDDVRARHREHIEAFASSPVNARRMGERASITARRRSGEIFPAEASISKVKIDGEWMFTVILRDATERKRTEDGLQFLSAAGKELNRSLDLADTLERVTRAAVPVLADCCAVDVFSADWSLSSHAVAATLEEDELLLREQRTGARTGTRTIFVEPLMRGRREPLIVPLLSQASLAELGVSVEQTHGPLASRLRSLMIFPLTLRSEMPAFMTFFMTQSGRRYDDSYLVLAAELASRVANAIDNAELYRRSQEAVAVRDEVVAIVSHDLRNPLSVVKMCASTLSEDPLPDAGTVMDLAHSIHQSAEWMNTIIQDLLDVARLESGKLVMRMEPVSLDAIVADAVNFHHPLAEERGLRLESDLPPDVPVVSVDALRISQVFTNLIGNALKFTERGGTITVRARCIDGRVVVSVVDTGRGIPDDDLPRLFDRFWQASRGDLKRGTGLGLAIAKGIVEAHGGRIWVESRESLGATFSFTLRTN
jgi:PAS domain S-box-containing protein